MGRLSLASVSIATVMVLGVPALATAQHGGGAGAAAAGHAGGTSSHFAAAPAHTTVHLQSGVQGSARIGAPVVRTRGNGVRIIHRANSGFNGTDFQDVPGLGFDFPHLAAISGNRRLHGGRFGGGFPFGFSGFLLSPPVIVGEPQAVESDGGVAEEEIVDDPPVVQEPRRRFRAPRPVSEPQAESAPTPQPDVEQYVFVRRDGGLVFAVGYVWEDGTLRYVTPEGLRRTIARDALDLNATQQFNEQRGLTFRAPA